MDRRKWRVLVYLESLTGIIKKRGIQSVLQHAGPRGPPHPVVVRYRAVSLRLRSGSPEFVTEIFIRQADGDISAQNGPFPLVLHFN